MKCDECGSQNEVIKSTIWWTAWGRSCFNFNWEKNEGVKALCVECEEEYWVICECGALVSREYEGTGYLPKDYDDDYLCPECAEKKGFERRVSIANSPW